MAYAPVTPAVNLSLLSGGAALPTTSIMTVGPRQLPSGAPVAASSITPAVLGRGHTLTVSVASDAVADRAFLAEYGDLDWDTELTEQLGAIETGANVIIIDACREHPVFQTSRKMWAVRPGFAQVVAPRGTLVAFSTRPGKVARDGDGANSIYATALTRALADFPTLPVEVFFKRVRTAVVEATRNEQVPWDSSDLYGELCFRSEANGLCRQFK